MMMFRHPLWMRFAGDLASYRRSWIAILFLSGSGVLVELAGPYVSRKIVDEGIIGRDARAFFVSVSIAAGLFLAGVVLRGGRGALEKILKFKVGFDLKRRLFRHIQGLSLSWFQGRSTGELAYKIDHDVGNVADLVTSTVPRAWVLFPRIALTFAVICFLSPRMALAALLLSPFLFLPYLYFSRRLIGIAGPIASASEGVAEDIQEILTRMPLVKAFGREAASVKVFLRRLIKVVRLDIRSARLEATLTSAVEISVKAVVGLITCYGGYEVIRGNLTPGTLAALMIYLAQLIGMQTEVCAFFQERALGMVSCGRISAIFDETARIVDRPGAKSVLLPRGEIVFERVSFGYRGGVPVLREASLRFRAGRRTALVGPSGCGKTTAVSLIVRLHEPEDGVIAIDGHDVRSLRLCALKDQIGFALQEPFLWNDTVFANILYGREDASRVDVLAAARWALVDEFTPALPQGYDTVIGENACTLSEGQKQKIAVARALIKRPKVLILDEAMSHMDAASESRILANIAGAFPEMTCVLVSHRLSTVMEAESVFYFQASAGDIREGRPREFLEGDAGFRRLFGLTEAA